MLPGNNSYPSVDSHNIKSLNVICCSCVGSLIANIRNVCCCMKTIQVDCLTETIQAKNVVETLAEFVSPTCIHHLTPILKQAIIKYINKLELEVDVVFELCRYFNRPIENMNLKIKNLNRNNYMDLAKEGFISSLDIIPKEIITKELCLAIVKYYPYIIMEMPKIYSSLEIFEVACLRQSYYLKFVPECFKASIIKKITVFDSTTIKYIPFELMSRTILENACKNDKETIKQISKTDVNYKKYVQITNNSFGISLEHLDEEEKTRSLCISACERNGYELKFVPKNEINYELCLIACKTSVAALCYIPENVTKQQLEKLYRVVCKHNGAALRYIPKESRTLELCKIAVSGNSVDSACKFFPENISESDKYDLYKRACRFSSHPLTIMPKHMISYELCLISARSNRCYFKHIPEGMRNDEIMSIILNYQSILDFQEVKIQMIIKENSVFKFITKSHQLDYFKDKNISTNDKLKLLSFVDARKINKVDEVNKELLISKSNPLLDSTHNPFMMRLIESAYCTTDFMPKSIKLGNEFTKYVNQASLHCTFELNESVANLILDEDVKLVGGRTLQIENSLESHLFFKFQRVGESKFDLAKEGCVYNFIKNNAQLNREFKSELPLFHSVIKIVMTEAIKNIISRFDDDVEVYTENGISYVNALVYHASQDYSVYAHIPDTDSLSPREKPEKGIIKACFDAGLLARMGVILPSLLPAFHDTKTERRWVALHSAMNRRNRVHSGSFGAWNTEATERPDFGYSGIRDLGDFEFLGEIVTCFKQEDTKNANELHPDDVNQRIGFCNAICETLISAILVRSRLQQQFEDYHYQNVNCLKDTEIFIERICNEFLKGLLGVNDPIMEKRILKDVLDVDEQTYISWLERAAKEIVYWTAKQDITQASFIEDSSLSEGYLSHIKRNGQLSNEFYPNETSSAIVVKHFFNFKGELNLGANNSTFPLISLMNGLTCLCSNILLMK